ncbi:MAG: glucokinase [Parachlamydiales bacterium]|nr:glucokinase [Parachlamydiales bacterium]
MILIGDIGGSKTHLGLIEEKRKIWFLKEQIFDSRDFSSLVSVIKSFLQREKTPVKKACFGVAGPVRNGRCSTTNLPWVIDAKELQEIFHISHVFLLNDLEANAYGIECLLPSEVYSLNEGKAAPDNNKALIAAGTGLGEAGMIWNGRFYLPFATEGGHVDFAPVNDVQIDLLHYLKTKYEHVSYERIVSGPGLYNIYQFLVLRSKGENIQPLEERMIKETPELISEWGMRHQNSLSSRALNLFLEIYGAEAGNLALKTLALGGLYIGGGIAPKILERLKEGLFFSAFCDKGRFRSLMQDIPIKVILNEKTALLGAGRFIVSL